MLPFPTLVLAIILCILALVLVRAWIWSGDAFAAAEIDKLVYHHLMTEYMALKEYSGKKDDEEYVIRIKALEKEAGEYKMFIKKHKGDLENAQTAGAFSKNPVAVNLSYYLSHSVSGRLFVIGIMKSYAFLNGVMTYFIGLQLNGIMLALINDSENEMTKASNRNIALAMTIVVSIFLIIGQTGMSQWAIEKFGTDNPSLMYKTKNMEILSLLQKQQQHEA